MRSFVFTAASNTTTLSFDSTSYATSLFGPTLDNVVVAMVPEPSSILTLLLGITGLGGMLLKRAHRSP